MRIIVFVSVSMDRKTKRAMRAVAAAILTALFYFAIWRNPND